MIFDGNGNRILSTSLNVAPGGDNAFQLSIECRAGYFLSAVSDDPDVDVLGKAAPGDSFASIIDDPIDLSPYANTVKTFYFDITAEADAAQGNEILQIKVSR